MNKATIIIISLFIILSLVGYGFGYLLSTLVNVNPKIKEAIQFLTTFFVLTTFYSITKIKLFRYFNIEEHNEN
jgi:archaellum component FlaF (FlaF/FlaG flagellin family)